MNKQFAAKSYLRIPEASEEYNISIPLLRKLIGSKKVRTIRPAGARIVLIPREALEQMMTAGKR